MIDYIPEQYYEPPAIIQVDDSEYPPTSDIYPDILLFDSIVIIGNNPTIYEAYAVAGNDYNKYHLVDTSYYFTDQGENGNHYPIFMVIYQGDISDSPKYRYYSFRWIVRPNGAALPGTANGTYLYDKDLPEGLSYNYNPVVLPSLEGNDVFWLYNFGSLLVSMGDKINDLLLFRIGDYNFLYLVASGGFLFYMGWCIVKWFIPL